MHVLAAMPQAAGMAVCKHVLQPLVLCAVTSLQVSELANKVQSLQAENAVLSRQVMLVEMHHAQCTRLHAMHVWPGWL